MIQALNHLQHLTDAVNRQIFSMTRELAALEEIRVLVVSKSACHAAQLWLKDSTWTANQLAVFVQITGELPPDDVKDDPDGTLLVLQESLDGFRGLQQILADHFLDAD